MRHTSKEQTVKTIELTTHSGDWRPVVEQVQSSGEAVTLTLDGMVCGLLLPTQEAHRLIARYAPAVPRAVSGEVPAQPFGPQNYLEMLRDDPTLVPVVDGQPLEFVTMMNSSYVDPEQLYQFRHPTTHQIYVYRASELQQAIGRTFVNVDFIPVRPKDFVEGKQ
jgi:hypothetical protein